MSEGNQSILQVENLSVIYETDSVSLEAVRGVSFRVYPGETYGIVGESGCGKSTTALAVMRYLGRNGKITQGRILFHGEDLLHKSEVKLQTIRGRKIGMVPQDPYSSLNPSIVIGEQIAEVFRVRADLGTRDAWQAGINMLQRVRMPDPQRVARSYPHQLSGGMQQRVLIAMVLAGHPELLLADEPTTGLDVTTEATILDLITELKRDYELAIVYITHNLGVIAEVCDRVGVMYAGQLVEEAEVRDLFHRPLHPYTIGLFSCVPRAGMNKRISRLVSMPGRIPSSPHLLPGCVFEPRCSRRQSACREQEPRLMTVAPGHSTRCLLWDRTSPLPPISRQAVQPSLPVQRDRREAHCLKIDRLKKYFTTAVGPLGFIGRPPASVKAVDGVSLDLHHNETLGVVGESGCGKTTLARCVVGLLEPTDGKISFEEHDITRGVDRRDKKLLRQIQMMFQNPDSTLNPRHTVEYAIGRPLRLWGERNPAMIRRRVSELLHAVQLDDSHRQRYPGELSGGEKQRVALARAFAGQPALLICDEPLASLDVSVQASVLNLLLKLQEEWKPSYLYISHNLALIQYLSDYVAVIYLGRLCEVGRAEDIFVPPNHPYTEALLSAIPIPDPEIQRERIRLEGPVPSAVNPPDGCRFHTRCHRKIGVICETKEPHWQGITDVHQICCHIPMEELQRVKPVIAWEEWEANSLRRTHDP